MNLGAMSQRQLHNHAHFMFETLAKLAQEFYRCDFSHEEKDTYVHLINDLNIHTANLLSGNDDWKTELQNTNKIISAASSCLNRHLCFRVLLSTIEINNNIILNTTESNHQQIN